MTFFLTDPVPAYESDKELFIRIANGLDPYVAVIF
jgi:hypothetical protein